MSTKTKSEKYALLNYIVAKQLHWKFKKQIILIRVEIKFGLYQNVLAIRSKD